MNHRSISAFVVVVVAGLAAPHFLAAASALVSGLIEPGARLAAFLAGHPRHPLQLAFSVFLLHVVAGVACGLLLAFAAERARFTRPSLLWLLYAATFLSSFAFISGLASGTVGHALSLQLLAFVLVSGVAMQLLAPRLLQRHAL